MNELVRLVTEHPVAQGVGLVALIVTVLSYQARTTRGIALRQAVGSFFWTAHLLLLGAWTGGLLNLLGLVRGSVYSQRGERAWASRPFWLVYDAFSGSIPGTLCEVFSQISLYVAIARNRE